MPPIAADMSTPAPAGNITICGITIAPAPNIAAEPGAPCGEMAPCMPPGPPPGNMVGAAVLLAGCCDLAGGRAGTDARAAEIWRLRLHGKRAQMDVCVSTNAVGQA
jgi:hypothetical protein